MTGTIINHNEKEYIITDFAEINSEKSPSTVGIAYAKLNTAKARKATKTFMVKKSADGTIWFDYVSAVRI